MLNGQICQLAILLRVCITSYYNSWKGVTPLCTQPHAMTIFKFLNSPFYIDITCEEILLGKVLIKMNSFWGRPIFLGMFPSLWHLLPILLSNLHSPHKFFIWRLRRCLVLLSTLLTFCQVHMTSHIGLIVSIFLVLVWLFPLVNPTMLTTYPSPSRHVLHKICFLHFFKVV